MNLSLHAEAIATRMNNAKVGFCETLKGIVPMPDETAARITEYYLKHKLARLDPVNGRITVKHGKLLDEFSVASAIIVTEPHA